MQGGRQGGWISCGFPKMGVATLSGREGKVTKTAKTSCAVLAGLAGLIPGLPLMTERESVHGILFGVMQVQCHVTRISEGNHKIGQFGRAAQWASNSGSLFETEELPGDDLSCASCSFRGFAREKWVPAAGYHLVILHQQGAWPDARPRAGLTPNRACAKGTQQKKKGLRATRNPSIFWLPDLGSNQGPTD